MAQEKEFKIKTEEKISFDHLKEELSAVKNIQVKATRKVKLMYQVTESCGCGGARTLYVEREVDEDSPLSDGDEISALEKGDKPARNSKK